MCLKLTHSTAWVKRYLLSTSVAEWHYTYIYIFFNEFFVCFSSFLWKIQRLILITTKFTKIYPKKDRKRKTIFLLKVQQKDFAEALVRSWKKDRMGAVPSRYNENNLFFFPSYISTSRMTSLIIFHYMWCSILYYFTNLRN